MPPKKILAQFTDNINSKAKKVVYPMQEASTGFGLVVKKPKPPSGETSCKLYKHFFFETKKYRDEKSAVYALIEQIQEVLPENIEELYWRYEPQVLQDMDFGQQPQFIARTRFSLW